MVVAYFSAEVGFESGLHTYSGGLGVLAGDHIKSAADVGLDLVAVTLLYRQGYGRQHLDKDGNQSETYGEINPEEYLCDTGVEISLPLDGGMLHSKVWLYKIKGISTYFLDTRHSANSDAHSILGNRLYGGDDKTRIRQEYLLGVGGIRALQKLGHNITGLHLNEGHCTFAMLEMLSQGWSREELSSRSLFTTHTPVPAGHDRFSWSDVEEVLGALLPRDCRKLGGEEYCSMSHLGIALAGSVNAVSNLNAWVASSMFEGTHIEPITNGVHHITWTSLPMAEVFDKHLLGWREDPTILAHAGKIPEEDLITARNHARSILRDLVFASTGVEMYSNRLTIGFARRFATYKRANLIFSDIERLLAIGAGKIQFVFAGKAHPKDEGGKQLIRDIFAGAEQVGDEIPVAFLEDYSMATGLAMTAGVDIWLNNPVRPMEASGTSGMKAAMNGVPNCSILDGWWPEACEHGVNGWSIGESEDDRDDARDVEALYNVLENEVLPTWDEGDSRWSHLMRAAICTSARFTGARMISDYRRFYDAFTDA
ncbi:MAG: alpha-glucan phosphorylase [Thermoplasmata archaeon]|nr:alpha-glucan phosphorylase [Thermoplasmata archaeon]|tara:strand:+ start:3058 stop:4674 length:1617 start_codon:yes stop_codon:yes gene_type:complete